MNIPRLLGFIVASCFLALVMAYLAGFFTEKIAPEAVVLPAAAAPGHPVAVRIVTEPVSEQATGTLRAKFETSVSSRIMATIISVDARAGDWVEPGTTLIVLDNRDLKARKQQAEQTVAVATAQLEQAKADYARVDALYAKHTVSKADLDRALATLRSREAEFERARGALAEAASAGTYSTIAAPIAGRVVERYAEPGDTATPGVPLLRLYDPGTLRLEADVRETLASTLKVGDRLNTRIDAIGRELPGIVDEIVPSADPGSRSFIVKVLLPAERSLYPGMFGRLVIPLGTTERLLIPTGAIQRVGQLEFVLMAAEPAPVRRYVRTGRRDDEGWTEVLSGLEPGEQVLVPTG